MTANKLMQRSVTTFSITFTVCEPHPQHWPLHPPEHDGRTLLDPHRRKSRLEPVRRVGCEENTAPIRKIGNWSLAGAQNRSRARAHAATYLDGSPAAPAEQLSPIHPNSAISWQPLQTPSEKVSLRFLNWSSCFETFLLCKQQAAHPEKMQLSRICGHISMKIIHDYECISLLQMPIRLNRLRIANTSASVILATQKRQQCWPKKFIQRKESFR